MMNRTTTISLTCIQRVSEQISDTIADGKLKSRVYFKNQERTPMFGKFVEMKDSKFLWSKGMVRFLSDAKIPVQLIGQPEWEPKDVDTKILTLSEIASIRNF